MRHQAFRYDFSMSELFYLMFRKKNCPKCGSKMTMKKCYETEKGAKFNSRADPFFVKNARVKHYRFFFVCSHCDVKYLLSDLVN